MIKNYQKNLFYNLNGELVEESVEAENILNFFYNNKLGRFFRKFFNKKISAQLYSFYQNSWLSKKDIIPFIKKYNINTSECLLNIYEYKNFNDFFIRKLKDHSRLIDHKAQIISPVDGKIFVIPNISQEIEFFVKNKKFNLEKFLQDKNLAREYQNGLCLIFRLAPYDYHRFHNPFDCTINKAQKVNGLYDSVNPIVFRAGFQPLIENERKLIKLNNNDFGEVLFIPVGAMFVGKIKLNYEPEKFYNRGDEIGYFEFGGSTIVLLFKNGVIKPKNVFVKNSLDGFETQVKMGQSITE